MPDFTNYHETDNWIKLHKDLCPATEDKDYCYKNGNIYSIGEFVSFRQVLKSYCEEIRKVLCSRTGADCKRELALFLYRYFLREMKYTSEEALNLTLDFNAHLSCPFDETVVLLSKGEVDSKKIRVEFSLEDMDMSEFQDGATYTQIKDYVLEHSGLKVSNLYISQIKRKCGIEVGKNYNLPKSEDSRQPLCPPEKEKAIREAFKYFGII